MKMNYLNLGCGDRFVDEWVNVDFKSTLKGVISHNLLKGVPFPDNKFDVVYHSHVLEHFSKEYAEKFIAECYRVMKPGAVLRIAVPDLEQIVKNYLKFLDNSVHGDKASEANYDWTMIELYDQAVRTRGGGSMGEYILNRKMINEDFVRQRTGAFVDIVRNHKTLGWKKYLKKIISDDGVRKIKRLSRFLERIFPVYKYYRLGKFRLSGEVHQWMYDRFSLGRMLRKYGFKEVTVQSAFLSKIEGWKNYNLDTEENGGVYKNDSLYIEAVK